MEERTFSFGYWVRRQRLALDLTQAALAREVGCATITIRKIEADERRPSRQMAERLAECLAIEEDAREAFVAAGLGERAADTLPLPHAPVADETAKPAWRAGEQPATAGFVGRARELAQLEEQLEAALQGDGRAVYVTGEAGQGKTALLRAFVDRALAAHGGLVAVQGNCAAAGGMGQPYLPFRDIMVSLSGDLEARWQAGLLGNEQAERLWQFAPQAAAVIAGEGAQLVDVLVPARSLARRGGRGFDDSDAARGDNAARRDNAAQPVIFENVTTVLQTLARQRPLLLVLDDLQWVDGASASLLFHLQQRLAGHRVLIVGAYRRSEALAEGETGGDAWGTQTLQRAVLEAARLFGENQIDLQRMETQTARQLSDALLDREPNELDEAFRVKLFWQTRGNPLFVIELLREMQAGGHLVRDESGRWVQRGALEWERLPGRVSAVVAQRLARLDEQARWALEVASVEGERFTAAVVAALTGVSEAQMLRLLGQMQRQHGLVEELGELQVGEGRLARFQFSHALFQHFLYESLGQAQRRQLHGAIAAALEELYAADAQAALPQLAHHFDAAGEREQAIAYRIRAGDRARVLYAAEEAAGHYGRAVALLRETNERQQLARTLLKLGQTHQIAFDYERARQALDEAFVLWNAVTGSTSRTTRARGADEGRALRMLWQDPPSLDPTMGGYNMTAPVTMQLFSGLVSFGPDNEIVPDVAYRWEVQEGGRRLVFHLRDDVWWSDGAAVTAHDFAFTYQRALTPATGAPIAGTLLYAVRGARAFHEGKEASFDAVGVRADDAHTLCFELEEPTSYFIHNLAYYVLLPTPRHVVARYGTAWTKPQHIVSNGPFLLASWERGRYMLLQRNGQYHGSFSGNVAQVYLTLAHAPEDQAALYEADQLDVASDWFGAVEVIARLRQQFPDEFVQREAFITRYYFLDPSRPPLTDRRVRQALAMAFDRQALVNVYPQDVLVAATGGFVPPGMPGHLADCALPFDVTRARQLLAEAGYGGGEGLPSLTLATQPKEIRLAQVLQESWREHLGIASDIKQGALQHAADAAAPGSPLIVMGGWIADYPDPDTFLRVDVQFDLPQWRNGDYLALLERAGRTGDQQARLGLYQQAERILAQEAVLVPMAYGRLNYFLKPWVKRYPTSAVKNPGFWKDVVVGKTADGGRQTAGGESAGIDF